MKKGKSLASPDTRCIRDESNIVIPGSDQPNREISTGLIKHLNLPCLIEQTVS